MSDSGNDPMSINSRNRDSEHHSKVIDKQTLVPVGVAITAAFILFQAASQWTTLQLKVSTNEADLDRIEKRLDIVEGSMTFWRREVERKLGPLPDYKPSSVQGAVFNMAGLRVPIGRSEHIEEE